MGIMVYSLGSLNYGNYGIFLLKGNAGFVSSTAFRPVLTLRMHLGSKGSAL